MSRSPAQLRGRHSPTRRANPSAEPGHSLCSRLVSFVCLLLWPFTLLNCAPALYSSSGAHDVITTPIDATTTLYPIGDAVVLLDASQSTLGDSTVTTVDLRTMEPTTGSTRWQLSFDVDGASTVLVLHHDENGLLLGIDDQLRYFDARDGRPRWTRTLSGPPQARWVQGNGRIYGTTGTQLISLRARNGRGFTSRDLGRTMVVSAAQSGRNARAVLVYDSGNAASISRVELNDRGTPPAPHTLNGTLSDSIAARHGAIIIAFSPQTGVANELHLLPESGARLRATIGDYATCYARLGLILCVEAVQRERAADPDAPWRSGATRLPLSRVSAFHPSSGLETPLWSVALASGYGVSSLMSGPDGVVAIDDDTFYTLDVATGRVLATSVPVSAMGGMNTCSVIAVTRTHVIEGCYGGDTPVLRARRLDITQPESL